LQKRREFLVQWIGYAKPTWEKEKVLRETAGKCVDKFLKNHQTDGDDERMDDCNEDASDECDDFEIVMELAEEDSEEEKGDKGKRKMTSEKTERRPEAKKSKGNESFGNKDHPIDLDEDDVVLL
jgi:hypothetical protein